MLTEVISRTSNVFTLYVTGMGCSGRFWLGLIIHDVIISLDSLWHSQQATFQFVPNNPIIIVWKYQSGHACFWDETGQPNKKEKVHSELCTKGTTCAAGGLGPLKGPITQTSIQNLW